MAKSRWKTAFVTAKQSTTKSLSNKIKHHYVTGDSDVHRMFTSLNAGPEALVIKHASIVECYFFSWNAISRQQGKNTDWDKNSAMTSPALTQDSRHVKLSPCWVHVKYKKRRKFQRHQYLRLKVFVYSFQLFPPPSDTVQRSILIEQCQMRYYIRRPVLEHINAY